MNFINHETDRDINCPEDRVYNVPGLLLGCVFIGMLVAGAGLILVLIFR